MQHYVWSYPADRIQLVAEKHAVGISVLNLTKDANYDLNAFGYINSHFFCITKCTICLPGAALLALAWCDRDNSIANLWNTKHIIDVIKHQSAKSC